jgi:hypothetical protein
MGKLQIQRQPRHRRHPSRLLFNFILERKESLCHNHVTSLVIELVCKTDSISLKPQGQRGFSLFLTRDLGVFAGTKSLNPNAMPNLGSLENGV